MLLQLESNGYGDVLRVKPSGWSYCPVLRQKKITMAVAVFIQVLIDRVMRDTAIGNCFHVTNQVSLKVTDNFI